MKSSLPLPIAYIETRAAAGSMKSSVPLPAFGTSARHSAAWGMNPKLWSHSSPLVTQTTTKQRAFGAHVPM